MAPRLFLGLDIGSSAIKASVFDASAHAEVARASSPHSELPINAPHPGWAEQDPRIWWEHVAACCAELSAAGVDMSVVQGIGIAYQMHGLVLVDADLTPLRPAIIWCDSRAAAIGAAAHEALSPRWCAAHLLNSPGNFTAAKLRWVIEHEPEIAASAAAMLLPGDYIAARLTGACATTTTGLSEAIIWDFESREPAWEVCDYFAIPRRLVPPRVPIFGVQGKVTAAAARELGLRAGVPVTYRAGDQPNNALALGALAPGDVAASAGTSGVVYVVTSAPCRDTKSRFNTFAHVTYTAADPAYGLLICINGCGSMQRWVRQTLFPDLTHAEIDLLAAQAAPGAAGLRCYPYGNGAERTLGDRLVGARLTEIDLNRHSRAHIARACQEGASFALAHGVEIARAAGAEIRTIRAAPSGLFRSAIFTQALSASLGAPIEFFDSDGAQGAARAAAFGAGSLRSLAEIAPPPLESPHPVADAAAAAAYCQAFADWQRGIANLIPRP